MADRLSMDSSAALAAGMSYGQYKVLHPHTDCEAPKPKRKRKRKRKLRRDAPMIKCEVCGLIFESHHGRKYCSEACSYQKLLERYAEKYRRNKERKKAEQQNHEGA